MRPTVENRAEEFTMFHFRTAEFPDHLHTQVELLIPTAGVSRARVNGRACEIRPGEALVVFPNQLHGYQGGGEGLMVIFSPAVLPDLGVAWDTARPNAPVAAMSEDARYCAARLTALCRAEEACAPVMALVHLLMAALLPALTLEAVAAAPVHDLLYQALAYISRHASKPLRLKQVARAVGVSECYLSHLLNERLCMGFRAYLNMLRVDRAKRLLRGSSLSVEAVGAACGFTTLRTFDRVFREQTGRTPRELKRAVGGGRAS